MFEPENEQGVIILFAQNCHKIGMEIVSIRAEYPDATVRYQGQEYLVEFEFLSSNFTLHRHDPRECDFIICWARDDDTYMTVIALSDEDWASARYEPSSKEARKAEYWRQRALDAESELKRLSEQRSDLSNGANQYTTQFKQQLIGLVMDENWAIAKPRLKATLLYEMGLFSNIAEAAEAAGVGKATISRTFNRPNKENEQWGTNQSSLT